MLGAIQVYSQSTPALYGDILLNNAFVVSDHSDNNNSGSSGVPRSGFAAKSKVQCTKRTNNPKSSFHEKQ